MKGAGARGGDGGERAKQLKEFILIAGSVAKIQLDRDQQRGQKKSRRREKLSKQSL